MRKYKGRVRMEVPQTCLTEVYRDAKENERRSALAVWDRHR